jgi:putative endonuclease
MFYTYVIKSIEHEYYYKGHCQDIEKRLAEHNKGLTKSIKPYIPFKLVYFEEFAELGDAIKREQYFKSAAGRRFLKNKISS